MQSVFDLLARSSRPFLLIGGQALPAYGLFRQTLDVDCLVAAEDEKELSGLLLSSGYRDIARSENFVRYHSSDPALPDVDLLLVDVSTFGKLWAGAQGVRRDKHELRVPSLPHLIALKLHAIKNNPQREARDLGDIAELLRLNRSTVSRDELMLLCDRFAPPGMEAKLLPLL